MLARTFFRLCALEALRPSALLATDGPWPTRGGKYVLDSRIDPIDQSLAAGDLRALVAVYTEGTRISQISKAGPLYHDVHCDLVFEIAVVTNFATEGGEVLIDFCETDGQTEAALDTLEAQIYDVLGSAPSGRLFRDMAKGVAESWHSEPRRSSEEELKLARRKITAVYRLKETYLAAPAATAPVDLARLPPSLRTIAAALDGSTYLSDLVLGVARSAYVMPTRVPLDSVVFTATPTNAPAPVQSSANNLQG